MVESITSPSDTSAVTIEAYRLSIRCATRSRTAGETLMQGRDEGSPAASNRRAPLGTNSQVKMFVSTFIDHPSDGQAAAFEPAIVPCSGAKRARSTSGLRY